jgi:hypothetical protein
MVRYACACLLLSSIGCFGGVDPKAPKLQPVTGFVRLDGEPLNNADIMFLPLAGDLEASGRSDAEGKYELHVRTKNGAVAGNYKVTISKRVREDGSEFPEDRSNMGIGKESLPMKYVDRNLTDLTAEVTEGENQIDFDLNSK